MKPVIDADVSQPLNDVISKQLAVGEIVIRVERPISGLVKWIIAWSLFAMGVVGAFYAVPAVSAGARGEWQPTGKPIPAVWGVLVASGHLLAMLGFMAAPLRLHWSTRGIAYVITNRRVLVIRRRFLGRIDRESIPGATLDLTLGPSRDGIRGDITLVAKGSIAKDREDMFRLVSLRDVRATEAVLRRLIQSSSKSSL